jgi:hypothetical protein
MASNAVEGTINLFHATQDFGCLRGLIRWWSSDNKKGRLGQGNMKVTEPVYDKFAWRTLAIAPRIMADFCDELQPHVFRGE